MKKSTVRILNKYGSDIMKSPEFKAGYKQIHHHHSTVAEHSIHVALISITMAIMLSKINVKTKEEQLVEAALCHDLGIIGRDEKYENNHICYRQHPDDSTEIARKLMTEYDDKADEMIRRHMWPFIKPTKAPKSLEGKILSLADKIAACTGH